MKSSRIALSLLLALQGAVVIALGNVEGQTGRAAQAEARQIVKHDAQIPMGPPVVKLLSPSQIKAPAVLPGVDPLDIGVEQGEPMSGEFDYFCYEYDADYETVYGALATPSPEPTVALDREPEPWADYDQYFANYGYDSLAEKPTDSAVEEVVSMASDDPNAEYLGYSLAYPEAENAYQDAVESSDVQALADISNKASEAAPKTEYEYAYDGEYEYVITEADGETVWEFVDPYEYYGYGDDGFTTASTSDSRDLSQWRAGELLLDQDVQLLDRLQNTKERERRAQLQAHLEKLGWYAVDFAAQYEEATGANVLDLIAEPIQTAALLAAYRLYEQGDVDTSEALDLLAKSIQGLSEAWLAELSPRTAPAVKIQWGHVAASLVPIVQVAGTLGSRSLVNMGDAFFALSHPISLSPWQGIVSQARQLEQACRPMWGSAMARR